MEKQNFEVKISLSDLIRIFIGRLWLILLAAVIAGGAVYAYSSYTYKPVYKSVSRIYILRQNDDNESAQSYAQSLNAALTTVNDCKLIIKTETTMQRVIDTLGLKKSATSLLSDITLSSSDDSRIVLITAKASDPETAKQLADAVAAKGVERIKEVMGYDQANIMENGSVPSSPSNSVYSLDIVMCAVLASALVYIFYLIKFLSNDKISEPEEVTDYLGLTVLGVIPNEDDAAGKKKYKGYGSYYKYKKYGYGKYQHTDSSGSDNKHQGDKELSKKSVGASNAKGKVK